MTQHPRHASICLLCGLVALLVAAPAVGDATLATTVGRTWPAEFQAWVEAWSVEQGGWIVAWWSADLDDDGRPDFVARVCRSSSDHALGAFLVQSARGKRFIDRFEDELGFAGCDQRTIGRAPRFRKTRDRFITYEVPSKRADSSQVWLALRDGQLVVVRERGDASYPEYPRAVPGSGKQQDGSWQLESSVIDLYPWAGSWRRRQ